MILNMKDGKIDIVRLGYLFFGGRDFDDYVRRFVDQVLIPFHRDFLRILTPQLNAEEAATGTSEPAPAYSRPSAPPFVDPARLAQLREISSPKYDLAKLVQLCEELNVASANDCYLSVAMVVRAIIDHVPPVFGVGSFVEVASNYRAGARSFRESMSHLSNSARKIGDAHLHVQIRARETLPTRTQVDFSRDLDVLLAEIVRILGR